ncbi:ABC transporter substrate-binding protein [Amycolatopsis sp. K13G38]|uniref:ABC transporter substrate-binding protein n=1 Tax=Amycolatopsis acididurans TaxID=2724524 RepID=A0ABX1IY52_9PSEU|nr:ABC transporter substrate-binding protein [Amycolatopsis acididurans]NKQ52422.1 ABC transporter substrate-binding protein [Amycolatopsis acididurans]
MRKLFQGAAFAVAAALVLTGCGRGGSEGGATPGITDTTVKLGAFTPLSGPGTVASSATKGSAAYFAYLNAEKGGVTFGDGKTRKIDYTMLDSQNSPATALQLTRQLVEQDKVFALYGSNGTSANLAVRDYLNQQKVPQLFLVGGASAFGTEHAKYPWTMPWQLDYASQGKAMAKYLLSQKPNAKIAVLYQNDDYGKDYYAGFKEGLGDKASQVVADASYELTDATVNRQVSILKDSGADTLADFSIDKFATQVIGQVAALGWNATHLLGSSGTAVVPASGDAGKGIISTAYLKVNTDPAERTDPAVLSYEDIIKKYGGPGVSADDQGVVYGVAEAQSLEYVLQHTKAPTREALMDAARSLDGFQPPMLLNGITLHTSADDYFPIQQSQIRRFDGKTWELIGAVLDGQ